MCIEYSLKCACKSREASFNFRDNLMPQEVIKGLYCPDCSKNISLNPETMLVDNGWVIEYDMDIAEFSATKLPKPQKTQISPDIIFDEGYATWRGIYPGEHIDNVREREKIIKLAKIDPRRYHEEIKTWSIQRMERFSEEGWRKANVS
jgi:hypothetical protein